jgi:hypothetical protein
MDALTMLSLSRAKTPVFTFIGKQVVKRSTKEKTGIFCRFKLNDSNGEICLKKRFFEGFKLRPEGVEPPTLWSEGGKNRSKR